ncbi:CotH kinase family protein [Planctomicrobium sp. SH664]|uniref:CotH kinase family protein n=1 Tax=Planctomicrobium sp. SH664 TaxID=3448125 RepID=UPI003F5C0B5B
MRSLLPPRGMVLLLLCGGAMALSTGLGAGPASMLTSVAWSQGPERPQERDREETPDGRPGPGDFRFGGPGGPGGGRRGGPGGPGGFGPQADLEIVKKFDQDGDKILNREERQAARKWLSEEGNSQRGGFGRGPRGGGPGGPRGPGGFGGGRDAGPGGDERGRREGRPGGDDPGFGGPGVGPRGFGPPGGEDRVAGTPGPKVKPEQVQIYKDEPLYAPETLRTLFLTFPDDDWEEELATFKNTDVELPATLLVDGKEYPQIGVSFRGMSSFMMIPAGSKRSLKLSLDLKNDQQRLDGYKTLNLLNSNGDASMMSAALYSRLAREHLPAPKVNFVKVVINGESWGVYANAQQFNKEFTQENYGDTGGARWKASGNPGADAGLRYLGDDVASYKQRFEIKTKDRPESWQALIQLCKVLNETPPEQLEEKLSPILDIDEVLWFLAYDMALVNEDGYWTRASDYNLYLDSKGKFHVLPHDMNEAFHAANGEGRSGAPGGRGGAPGFGPPGGGPNGGGPGRRGPDGEERRFAERGAPRQGDRPPGDNANGPQQPEGDFPFPPRSGGPGGPRGMMRPTVTVDPLVAIENERMPLHSKLLAVPKFRAQYLANIREIAEKQLDWKTLGPIVAEYRNLIQKEVKADTRKLSSYDAFVLAVSDKPGNAANARTLPLRMFADQRREFLLKATAP